MATTVAQHSVATFTSPVNGTTPIDANTVRGNDNTVRSSYNDHDADPGIHVQSSTLASRPVAGTAGRKWITEDSSVYTLWFDDGTHWHPVSSENIALTVLAGENLVKGDVVKVTGWNNGQDLPEVVKTTSAADTAFAVITATVTSGSLGYATNTGIVQDVNTAAYSVGTILYANGSGGFTSTKPTSGNYQPVAYVLRANASNGVYYVEFSTPRIVERSDNTASTVVLRDSNGDFSAGTITATAVNATTLDLTNLEVTNIKAKDGTQAIAIADSTGATTFSANVAATLSTASQPNITSVGTLSSLTVSGNTNLATVSGNVGVGTASPGARLEVQGASSATELRLRSTDTTSAQLRAYVNSLEAGKLEFTSARALNIETAGSLRASIDASGNLAVDTNTLYVDAVNNRVGVGTASPAHALDVVIASGPYNGRFRNSSTSTSEYNVTLWSQGAAGSAIGYVGTGGSAVGGAFANTFVVGTQSSNALVLATNDFERVRLDASGNLGLGVTPSAWGGGLSGTGLQVGAYTSITSANAFGAGYGFNFYYDGTNYRYVASNFASLIEQSGGAFRFKTAASGTAGNAITFTQAMTLDASGNLGVGATSPAFALGSGVQITRAGIATLRMENSTASNGLEIAIDSTANGVRFYGLNNAPFVFAPNASERMRIDNTSTAGQTALLLYDVDNNTVERVTVGAADSGGTGFKVLRIPN